MNNKDNIEYVYGNRVSCNGGDSQFGHPKVSLYIGKEGYIQCNYCSKRFELNSHREK